MADLSGDDVFERACAFTNRHLVEWKRNDSALISEIVSDAIVVDDLAFLQLWDAEDFNVLFERIKEIMKQRHLWRD